MAEFMGTFAIVFSHRPQGRCSFLNQRDAQALAARCRFADCSHSNEPGCAIRKSIENGELNAEHYQSYLKLKAESEYNEMSYVDKRNKDKASGKMVKTVLKE